MSAASTLRTPWVRARRTWAGVPLRTRLVAILLAALIAALLTTALVTQTALRGYLVGQVDQQLQQDSPTVARIAFSGQPRFGPVRQLPRGYVVNLWGGDGQSERTVPATLADTPSFPRLSEADINARQAEPYTVTSPSGQRYRAVAFNLVDSDNVTVSYAQVAVSLNQVDQSVARARLLILGRRHHRHRLCVARVAGDPAVVRTAGAGRGDGRRHRRGRPLPPHPGAPADHRGRPAHGVP